MVHASASSKVSVVCPCGRRGVFPESLAGRKLRCRGCKQVLRVPAPSRAEVISSSDGLQWLMVDGADDDVVVTPFAEYKGGLDLAPEPEVSGSDRFAAFVPPPRRPARAARADHRHRRHHGHVAAIAFWYRAQGLLGFVGAALSGVAVAGLSGWLALAVMLTGFAFSALAYAVGRGLAALSGWARWVVGILAAIGALAGLLSIVTAPTLGTVAGTLGGLAWNGAVLWALFGAEGQEVFQPAYRKSASGAVPWLSSPFFWVPAILLGIVFLAAMTVLAGAFLF